MNRLDFQRLAYERVRDADSLLFAGQWPGAYYLAGYAVECALKACVARLTNQHDFPDKVFAARCYTHNIETLVEAANLIALRNAEGKVNVPFGKNWTLVKDWNEASRYLIWSEAQARKLYAAVNDPATGVFPWIAARW